MTQIAQGFNVFVKTEKLLAWDHLKHNPRELTRRLLKQLISEEDLKLMTAIGRNEKMGVPEEIRESIFCKKKLFELPDRIRVQRYFAWNWEASESCFTSYSSRGLHFPLK